MSVTETTALNVTAVYAAVDILARTLASLPLPVYRRLRPRGKERATAHPLYTILHDAPNPEMTSFEFRQALMGHLALWGNAYAEIERNRGNRVVALWPLRPDRMSVERSRQGLIYRYRKSDGAEALLPADRILHLRGLSSDGRIGYSPIRMAREAIGLAIATERFGAAWFGNGSRPGGVLQHPGKLSDEAAKRLKKSWESLHQGLDHAHRIAILEEGMTWQQVGIPPEDSQFLQTRQFQVTEIARIFHVPPHMLADLSRSTFSNIEHQAIEFVVHTMRPWLVCWEQAINLRLFSDAERREYFAEFVVDGLLRGDTESRYRAYSIARQWGWMSANDVRELENLNPVEGGDVYLVPLNMVPADSITAPPPQQQTRALLMVGVEERELRAMTTRRKTQQQFYGLFRDTERRITAKEVAEIRAAAEKYLMRRSEEDFLRWLEEFYARHRRYTEERWTPVYHTYAQAVATTAAEEIGKADFEWTPELERFLRDYVASHAALHVESARGQIRQLIREALDQAQDPLPVIERRLQEWEERRPDKIASRETVQAQNAVAVAVFAGAGIQRLRWRTFGENCPYCQHLDGRVVGIQEWFLSAGQDFHPDGADRPLTPTVNVRHPPAHEGCDCMVMASI